MTFTMQEPRSRLFNDTCRSGLRLPSKRRIVTVGLWVPLLAL
jgi:hypothetical protein